MYSRMIRSVQTLMVFNDTPVMKLTPEPKMNIFNIRFFQMKKFFSEKIFRPEF